MEKRLKVFISYARSDQTKVRDLYERLTNEGLDTWIDKKNILPGQDWDLEIRNFIRKADVVIVCLSKNFDKAGFRQKEVRFALDIAMEKTEGEIFIIPVRLEECENLQSLGKWTWVDLFNNPPIASAEDGYEDLMRSLRQRANDVGAILRPNNLSKVPSSRLSLKNKRLVPDDIVLHWLIRNDMVVNPFRFINSNGYMLYPEGVIRPNQWDFFFDPIPLFAHCSIIEDAQSLFYLIKRECLHLEEYNFVTTINRHIFPVLVWPEQTFTLQPLVTLAHSAVRTWLDILPTQPFALLDLADAEQGALLELLNWSLGSKRALINLIQDKSKTEIKGITALIQKIRDFNNALLSVPHEDVLLSWLKIRPSNMKQTSLIFFGDDLFHIAPEWQSKQFSSLVSTLSSHEVVTKVLATSFFPVYQSLSQMKLSWSTTWLKRSLDGQFDAAMHPLEKSMGKFVHFHELFGPGATEEDTTNKLISACHNSLARMLMLGNCLLQRHCEKHGVAEKYLFIEDLDAILETA